MTHRLNLFSLLLAVSASSASGQPRALPEEWDRLVAWVAVIQAEYPPAHASGSEVALRVQLDRVDRAIATARTLGPDANRAAATLESIESRMHRTDDPLGVAEDCGKVVDQLVRLRGLSRSPLRVPNLAHGEQLYASGCSACHGADGHAQTAVGAKLKPSPKGFHEGEAIDRLTPHRVFQALHFGVPGSAMPSFSTLDEQERWDLAFFVFTFRQPPCDGPHPQASLETLATRTDQELAVRYGADAVRCLRRTPTPPEVEGQLGKLREAVVDTIAHGAPLSLAGLETLASRFVSADPWLASQLVTQAKTFATTHPAAVSQRETEGRELLWLIDQARALDATAPVARPGVPKILQAVEQALPAAPERQLVLEAMEHTLRMGLPVLLALLALLVLKLTPAPGSPAGPIAFAGALGGAAAAVAAGLSMSSAESRFGAALLFGQVMLLLGGLHRMREYEHGPAHRVLRTALLFGLAFSAFFRATHATLWRTAMLPSQAATEGVFLAVLVLGVALLTIRSLAQRLGQSFARQVALVCLLLLAFVGLLEGVRAARAESEQEGTAISAVGSSRQP